MWAAQPRTPSDEPAKGAGKRSKLCSCKFIMRENVAIVAGSESTAQDAPKKAKNDVSNVQCFHCLGYGHFKSKCPSLPAKDTKSS